MWAYPFNKVRIRCDVRCTSVMSNNKGTTIRVPIRHFAVKNWAHFPVFSHVTIISGVQSDRVDTPRRGQMIGNNSNNQ